jgi:hypothetical protein
MGLMIFLIPPHPARAQSLAEAGDPFASIGERDWALLTLTSEGSFLIEEELKRISSLPESDKRDQALGMLYIARYIRSEKRRDAYDALELLEPIPAVSPLQLAYLGMAHAFVARIRTVFGVKNLEAMQEIMRKIPEQHPDYLVRFLRGNTLVQVGRGLPSVFSIKEIKEEAIRVGTKDLEYTILQEETPAVMREQALKVLGE